ncbi:MAG: glycosyltransferase [Spirochaetales bacterium]|nr:glycosyltransferase [Spirochaetales bacterium]
MIIPARNEAENLPALFQSLKNQKYSNFEIILIDDRSEDNSLDLMKSFQKETDFKVKVIENKDSPGTTNPKVNVLLKGISLAEGELYFFTDADCIAGENWINSLSAPFSDNHTGIVCGFLSLTSDSSPLCLFQNFDHFYRMLYGFGAIGLGIPVGCFGNNLAIRRETYLETGGYEELLHSATEDAELIGRVKKAGNYAVRALFSRETFIETLPENSWKEHTNQAVRWAAGAVFSTDVLARVTIAALMLIDALCLLGLLLGFIIHPTFFILPVLMYSFLYASSIVFGLVGSVNPAYWKGLFISVLLYPIIYIKSFIITIITRKINWKGTILSWKHEKKKDNIVADNAGAKHSSD